MRSDPRVESSDRDRYIFRLEEEKCEPDKNDKTEPCQQRIAIESVLHILNSKPPTIEQPSGLDSTFWPLDTAAVPAEGIIEHEAAALHDAFLAVLEAALLAECGWFVLV